VLGTLELTSLTDTAELSPLLHPKTEETEAVSGNLCFLVTYNSGRWAKSTNPLIMSTSPTTYYMYSLFVVKHPTVL
jgi:hypothetical protein